MFLSDKDIKNIKNLITPFSEDKLQGINYDLAVKSFYYVEDEKNNEKKSVELNPLDSVFVATNEVIELPEDIAATVHLRNRFIRVGLHLDSPVYLPGHKTRVFFRVTNLSQNKITLEEGQELASIFFQKVSTLVSKPYSGQFKDEIEYSGLGNCKNILAKMIKQADNKFQKIDKIETNIYGNVMVMMTIFVALFSLINVNLKLAERAINVAPKLIVLNLSTIGSIAALVYFMQSVIKEKARHELIAIAALCIVVAILVASSF